MRPTMPMFVSNKAKCAIPMLNASGLEDPICCHMAEDIYSARVKQSTRLLPLYGVLRKTGKIKGPFKVQHICLTYAIALRKREKEQAKKVPKKGASKANAQARRHKKEENRLKIAKENGDTRGKEIVQDGDMDVMMD